MGYDLLLDTNGDFSIAPNNDIAGATGADLLRQRVRLRLLIPRGWEYDPTGGELGSRLSEMLRQPIPDARANAELFVREALEPMQDISIEDVQVFTNDDDPRIEVGKVKITILCLALADTEGESSQVVTSVTV